MQPKGKRSLRYQSGFSLVEIMVGLGIGLLATVVIIQVLSVFEAQRRTTTGTADAQTSGGIALYTIGRELQMAGYPLMPVTDSALECTTLTVNGTVDTVPPTQYVRLSPVTIANGVAAAGVSASDAITIRYGTAPFGGVPTPITIPGAPGPNDETLGTNLGCQAGDISLITNGNACAMSSINAVTGTTSVTLANAAGAAINANLACMGAWNEVTYRASGGNLERCVLATAIANGGTCNPAGANANFVPTLPGIVNLQAQYGIAATASSNVIIGWVNASGGTWAAPTVADRNRIKSVRIAVVARNAKLEPNAVTSACSSTTAAAPTGLCAWDGSAFPAPAIDLSPGDPDWARYRYRVFETIIPLRNMIWAKDTL
jgi:type IV pilus assembly protein PilW